MIETMDKQHKHFVSEVREFSLLHEIAPSLPSLRPKASLYDDYESSLPLQSDFIDEAPSTNLEEVFDPLLISLHLLLHPFLVHL